MNSLDEFNLSLFFQSLTVQFGEPLCTISQILAILPTMVVKSVFNLLSHLDAQLMFFSHYSK